MPRGDRTGPMGMGPMTGRKAGYCNGFTDSGDLRSVPQRFACGIGRRQGRRRMCVKTGLPGWMHVENSASSEAGFDENSFLQCQAEYLELQLEEIKRRMSRTNEEVT